MKSITTNNSASLRVRAEQRLEDQASSSRHPQPGQDTQRLVHELEVHQIELEMQLEELRHSQLELEKSRERYVEFYDFAPVGYVTLTQDGMINEINLTGAIMLGAERRNLLHHPFIAHISIDDRNRWQRQYLSLLDGDSKLSCELALLRSDRSQLFVRLDCLRLDGGGIGPVVRIVLSDITDRKRAETDLRIAAVAFESQEPMIVCDANNVILRVNRAFTEDTGYTVEEAVGQTPRILKSGHHDTEFYRVMWESISSLGKWQGEIWDKRKNGAISPKWLSISVVKDDAGDVTHYVAARHDISERKKAEERIRELAFFDQLTGLPNRTLLLDRLSQAMTASARSGSYGGLLYIDLDNFKTLNDTHGHNMGDLFLKQVAQRMTASVRVVDTVARLGGDEFVVMLVNLSKIEEDAVAQTKAVGAKILTALNKTYQLGSATHQCTGSVGAVIFTGNQTPMDDLLKQADLAMYRSKQAGRNCLQLFDRNMENVEVTRTALEGELHNAIRDKQFLLHYQAQMAGTRVAEVEALVRWQHPQRGLLSPAEFIPLAEKTGLILPLGQWILEAACAQLASWATHTKLAHLKVAVNVSAQQFRQPDFVDQVLTVLNNSGANPEKLKLELTEGLLLSAAEDVIEKMFALKAKGVSFALDDFCTSYSSLTYLRRMPLDQLKIDQSFVHDVLSDSDDASVAQTIIALAQGLGLGVMAEGVETVLQQDFLANAGCHAYQGYLFSKPLPVEDFEVFATQI